MSFFISPALAEGAASAPPSPGLVPNLFLLGGFLLIFYFLILRPQNKRQKEHKALIDNLAKGDEVVTNGGLLGKITKVDDDYAVIDIADKVEIKIQKPAISATLPKGTLKAI